MASANNSEGYYSILGVPKTVSKKCIKCIN